ncbi:MAG: IS1380 family transposase [Mycobacterium sp.]
MGIEELVNESVWLDPRAPGACLPGRKVMSLLHGMLAGADRIDQMNVLRAGSTGLVVGHRVMAPSTLGTFLRAFTFGHVRQLDHVLDVALARAWAAGAGPGDGPLVIDVDSFIGEVCSDRKQGASYGYTKKLGYHPILAVRSDTGEVLHIRNRQGKANTQRGFRRFVEELIARVRRAGHSGLIIIRADSGFENRKLMRQLARQGVEFSIGIKQSKAIKALIALVPEEDWVTIVNYPDTGEAQIAQTTLGEFRLIVRRTRLVGAQAELFPDWRHHAFATNRTLPTLVADVDHRDHATIELAIRDLKDQALCHFPSGQMDANSAWTVIAALAHNLGRWTTQVGLPDRPVQTARARRRQLLAIPARLTRTSRQWTLRMPARWPWQTDFTTVLDTIRQLPARC